ncbi:MAG: hypothetical protein WCJ74_00410 [bacterium]
MEKYTISEEGSLKSGVVQEIKDGENIIDTSVCPTFDEIKRLANVGYWSHGGDISVSERNVSIGNIEWDKNKNYFYQPQNNGHMTIRRILERSKDEGVKFLNVSVLKYLFLNREQIPEDWKGKRIFFLGSVFVNDDEYELTEPPAKKSWKMAFKAGLKPERSPYTGKRYDNSEYGEVCAVYLVKRQVVFSLNVDDDQITIEPIDIDDFLYSDDVITKYDQMS